MSLEYTVTYHTENSYENDVSEAFWQFCIIPESNENQELIYQDFENDQKVHNEVSINGLGFDVVRIRPKESLKNISFKAKFKLIKKEYNPFDFLLNHNVIKDYQEIADMTFIADHEPYLRKTRFTLLPKERKTLFGFNTSKPVFENLLELNTWVFKFLFFKTGVTDVNTTLGEVIENRHGVCQDFTHLFCALARENNIPTRYVSGYLHQGNGYFGDSQMHAWAESYVPNAGWVGFDPTNNILVAENHIKVAHGKDYQDCPPIKGVIFSKGGNSTKYSVEVQASQQQ